MDNLYEEYNITREEMAAYLLPENFYEGLDELAKDTKEGKRIFCFGAGKIGEYLCEQSACYDFNFENLYFVDNNKDKIGKAMSINAPIISKEEMLRIIDCNDIIFITVGRKFVEEIYKELIENSDLRDVKIIIAKLIPCFTQNSSIVKYTNIPNQTVGYCPICEKNIIYNQFGKIPRYDLLCNECYSEPRQRAVIVALDKFVPNWRKLVVHESSPGGASADYIKNHCQNYTYSQYFSEYNSGDFVSYEDDEILCQNIEDMSFENESFDLFITQDVFEHVMNPCAAFKEIGRVLKKGGVHLFTVPWYGEYEKSRCRAKIDGNGGVLYLEEPMYHGNTVSEEGSLVVYDWGRDLIDIIYRESGMVTTVFLCESEKLGLTGEFLEVFISIKK